MQICFLESIFWLIFKLSGEGEIEEFSIYNKI